MWGGGTTYERRQKFVTKLHVDLVFQACILFLRCFRTLGTPIRKIQVYPGLLPCLVPQSKSPQIMQSCISFRSRSDLVLDADHLGLSRNPRSLRNAGNFLSRFTGAHLVYRVSDQSGALLFLPCSHKNAIAHMWRGFWAWKTYQRRRPFKISDP